MLLRFFILASLIIFQSQFGRADANTPGIQALLKEDLRKVLVLAGQDYSNSVQAEIFDGTESSIQFFCKTNLITMRVVTPYSELSSTFYYGVYQLGFRFPHPRQQISPTLSRMRETCGKKFDWRPTVKFRGFHLHTLYTNEYHAAFFLGDKNIGEDYIWWLAHNMQNYLEVQMLRGFGFPYQNSLAPLFHLANQLGISTGLAVSLTLQELRRFYLLPSWSAITTIRAQHYLESSVNQLLESVPFQVLNVDISSVGFASMNFKNVKKWIELLDKQLAKVGRRLYVKVHASMSDVDSEHGNLQLIATNIQSPTLGTMIHTTGFYSLNDESTPVYNRKNFSDLREVLFEKGKSKAPAWYFPSTGYYLGMDVDVPLLLTDYLKARTDDFKLIVSNGITGHITFSVGQEMGHWLFDWQVALQALPEHIGDHLAALKELGESPELWTKIMDYQSKFFKDQQAITMIAGSTLFDELPFIEKYHERTLVRDLDVKPTHLQHEFTLLEKAAAEFPNVDGIKNDELRQLMQVTQLRVSHAMYIRGAARNYSAITPWLENAKNTRTTAEKIVLNLSSTHNRYKDAGLFEKQKDSTTSFPFGYLWTAKTLYYWSREELVVQNKINNPFYLNIYSVAELLL